MQDPQAQNQTESPQTGSPPARDLPPGDHPSEVAARKGFGPLHPSGTDNWHGGARPCVSCGQLVRRDAKSCDECGQDLSSDMMEKMLLHAGPWFVFDHVRPFPGVSLERVIRQIRRGTLTATSIIRGPATKFQWMFAAETPGICLFFGRCWQCGKTVRPTDIYCDSCHCYLGFEQPKITNQTASRPGQAPASAKPAIQKPPAQPTGASADTADRVSIDRQAQATTPDIDSNDARLTEPPASPDDTAARRALAELSAVVDRSDVPLHDDVWDEPPRIGRVRASWIAVAMIAIAVVVLLFVVDARNKAASSSSSTARPATQPAVRLNPTGTNPAGS